MPGVQERHCKPNLEWSNWSECGGTGQVGPVAETCGNTADDDCNGLVDEGCTCPLLVSGEAGAVPLPGHATRLLAHPARCLVYAIVEEPPQVVVVDTGTRSVVAVVPLPFRPIDADLSPQGTHLVIGQEDWARLAVVDQSTWTIAAIHELAAPMERFEIDDAGAVTYITGDGHGHEIHRTSLAAVTVDWKSPYLNAGDLELSADGTRLFSGESWTTGGDLLTWDVVGNQVVPHDHSIWNDDYGFSVHEGRLYLSPGGQHIYYSGYQLDAADVRFVRGFVGTDPVLAEDVAGRFFVTRQHLWDADTVLPVGTLPSQAAAAVVATGDSALWWAETGSPQLRYAARVDLVDDATLGQRDRAPGPLSDYTFAQLLVDPLRPRLYGLDRVRGSVVIIDRTTHAPVQEVIVGTRLTTMAFDRDAVRLWIGSNAFLGAAAIDLDDAAFAGITRLPRLVTSIAPLTGAIMATIDDDQWTRLTWFDGDTGAVIGETYSLFYAGELASAPDGTLYVGETSSTASTCQRFSIEGATITQLGESSPFYAPGRNVLVPQDDRGVFYGGQFLGTPELTPLYAVPGPVRAVSSVAQVFTTDDAIHDLSTGVWVADLPGSTSVQAVSADGETLFMVVAGSIVEVDLTPAQP